MQTARDLSATFPPRASVYGERSSGEPRGAVFTQPHVVRLVLDLAGYTADRDLASLRLLEPACGDGAFLIVAVERLIASARRHGRSLRQLGQAIAAYDIDPRYIERARGAVSDTLHRLGLSTQEARRLAMRWVAHRDFLLTGPKWRFDAVVGNPPYVRIEHLSPRVRAMYRQRYRTLHGRADLYVAFMERGLRLLAPSGVLALICADRWTRNKYGARLRRMLSERFRIHGYIDLHRASPFAAKVSAYPSIVVITPGTTDRVPVVTLDTASPTECASVMAAMKESAPSPPGVTVEDYPTWFEGDEPWVLSSPVHLAALRSLEARFAPLEHVGGTRVGIGVATGNDEVYIVGDHVDIERDRLVPLLMREDLEKGRIRDARRFVINTFGEDGKVVDLRLYPKLAAYLNAHASALKKRHLAKNNPSNWFRTIDRVYPERVGVEKLLLPDISGANDIVYERGRFHPHHNLYFITSTGWDLEALGGLLSSKVALFFIWSYAVKMRGGYLRFQAQYLRRIRLPSPDSVGQRLIHALRDAFRKRDFATLDELALRAYGLEILPEFSFVDTRT